MSGISIFYALMHDEKKKKSTNKCCTRRNFTPYIKTSSGTLDS